MNGLSWGFVKREKNKPTAAHVKTAQTKPHKLSWGLRKRLYRQTASQLENQGVLPKVLEDFRDRQTRRNRKKAAAAVHHIYRQVRDGATLVDAMGSNLTDLERTLLGSGETAGRLAESMNLILRTREMTDRMTRALAGSLFSPVTYALALYATLVLFGDYIVPQFASTAPVSKWTGWAYAMYLLGQIAVGWTGPILLVLLVAAVAVTLWAMPRWTGRGRTFCDRYVFPFTIYREIAGFSWLVAFATLISAGVPNVDALETQLATASPWLRSRLLPIRAGLRNGLNMGAAMRMSGYDFPSLDLIDDVAAYVDYADFPVKIKNVCDTYAATLERMLLFKGMVLSAIFTAMMFAMMAVLQLGANELSSILSTSYGSF
ncbi:type II secretion system F family protein [Paraburkholderia sp. A3RO-2L]|uniref:type II secretion system F family protein n=1 Tax=Paraburkholderia sp. A3RO-2L TaxID=3028376 RepID=UPI003DA927CE